MSIRNKLSRMKGHMNLPSNEQSTSAAGFDSGQQVDTDLGKAIYSSKLPQQAVNLSSQRELQRPRLEAFVSSEDWSSLNATPLYLEDQYTIYREVSYPLDYKLGAHRFSELKEVIQLWNQADADHPLAAKGLSDEQLLFFDIETTGLGGGTGNTIFLIGYCHIEKDHVKVKQFFLPGPAHEVALYYHFLKEVQDLSNLVTYNGKSFDWPQVRTRHTLVRDQVPKLPKFGHFDLLHAARRLWKHTLPSCRLSIVEKEKLEINRVDDTPGSLAPLLYFDFLKVKDPKIIAGVLKHNELDVLSLITLYIHISKKLLNIDPSINTFKEKYEIARWFQKEKQLTKAAQLYQEVANSNSIIRNDALLSLGLLLKKQKKLETAIDCFLILVEEEASPSVLACIELAKLYEHQFRDCQKALYYADLGYNRLKTIQRLVKEGQVAVDLKNRIERLTRKL